MYGLEGTDREPTDEQIKEAATLANAASFIEVRTDASLWPDPNNTRTLTAGCLKTPISNTVYAHEIRHRMWRKGGPAERRSKTAVSSSTRLNALIWLVLHLIVFLAILFVDCFQHCHCSCNHSEAKRAFAR